MGIRVGIHNCSTERRRDRFDSQQNTRQCSAADLLYDTGSRISFLSAIDFSYTKHYSLHAILFIITSLPPRTIRRLRYDDWQIKQSGNKPKMIRCKAKQTNSPISVSTPEKTLRCTRYQTKASLVGKTSVDLPLQQRNTPSIPHLLIISSAEMYVPSRSCLRLYTYYMFCSAYVTIYGAAMLHPHTLGCEVHCVQQACAAEPFGRFPFA